MTLPISAIIQQNVLSRLEALHLSQQELADRASVKHPVVSRAVNGKMENVELKTIAALAHGLGCQAWEIIHPEGAKFSQTEERLEPSLADVMKKFRSLEKLYRTLEERNGELLEVVRELKSQLSAIPPARATLAEVLAAAAADDTEFEDIALFIKNRTQGRVSLEFSYERKQLSK